MGLEKIQILGFRGFKTKQELKVAEPNGQKGSGLTIVTGANNSGKSSIIECLKARQGHNPPSFTVGARNTNVDMVEISYFINGNEEKITTISKGSSETNKNNIDPEFQIFVLPSRRSFNPYFDRNIFSRDQYLQNGTLPAQRSSLMSNFQYRLFNILENKDQFNEILHKVLVFKPDWSIDQSDQGQYFLKFFNGNEPHSSDGMGEGIVSIFAIVDSLYDSKPGDVIVIDEPELSLHPMLQKRVFDLLSEYAKDRQIIISTHSPYFVDMVSIVNGAHLARIVNNGEGTIIYQISETSKEIINKLSSRNLYNPHTFGLDAKELFFQDDNIIVVEGQEDVLLFPLIYDQLQIDIKASFFGWGAGGASNISFICTLLKELGFENVAAILDGDKAEEVPKLKKQFPNYHFVHIAADDIRTKPSRKSSSSVDGLLDEKRILKEEYQPHTQKLLNDLNEYMMI